MNHDVRVKKKGSPELQNKYDIHVYVQSYASW